MRTEAAQASPYGRPDDIRFTNLSLDDGLSQSVVMCIVQDYQSFIWLYTQDGLNRFDGYEFEIYEHDPEDRYSLADSFVWSAGKDRSGTLWVERAPASSASTGRPNASSTAGTTPRIRIA